MDKAEHTLFKCNRWEIRRINLKTELGEPLTPETIGRAMLESKANWEAVSRYTEDVMREKKKEEQQQTAAARV